MKLAVQERINLLNILPATGDDITLKVLRKLREALSFNEDEILKLNFRRKFICPKCKMTGYSPSPMRCEDCKEQMIFTGDVTWKPIEWIKDVHTGVVTEKIITDTLKMLNANKGLPDQLFDLFERLGLAAKIPDDVAKELAELEKK